MIRAHHEAGNKAADGGGRSTMPRLASVVLALLAVACGDDGGTAASAAPTPVYPEGGGHWEGALHDTRRSAPPEWDVGPCNSLASCAA